MVAKWSRNPQHVFGSMLVLYPQSGNSSGTSLEVPSEALLQVAKRSRNKQVIEGDIVTKLQNIEAKKIFFAFFLLSSKKNANFAGDLCIIDTNTKKNEY